MATLLYQGHGSYRITTNAGKVIYVDPFAGEGYDVPADLIIVTHEHGDHTQVDKMPHAEGCEIFRSKDLHPFFGSYLTIRRCGVTITAVEAENKNHPLDKCMGVVLDVDGVKVYGSGDTSTTDDMRTGKLRMMNLDYAILCGDGFYNMGVEEASEAAKLIAAKHSIPVHLVPIHDFNDYQPFCRETAEKFQAEGRIILEPGETLEL